MTLAGPFTVTDDKATATCTQPSDAALSPNETMSCSASYTITQSDLDAGSVTNKATATNGTINSNQATATVQAVPHPSLSLVKTANPLEYNQVGQTISYSYAVKNTGNVALAAPFTVSDDKADGHLPADAEPTSRRRDANLHGELRDRAGGPGRRVGDEPCDGGGEVREQHSYVEPGDCDRDRDADQDAAADQDAGAVDVRPGGPGDRLQLRRSRIRAM